MNKAVVFSFLSRCSNEVWVKGKLSEFLQTSKLASDPCNSEILEETEEDVKIIQCPETFDQSPILVIF